MDENIDSRFERRGHSGPDEIPSIRLTKEDLWESDPQVKRELWGAKNLEDARNRLIRLMSMREAWLSSRECELEDLERVNAVSCVRVLKNFFSTKNEELTGHSVLETLYGLSSGSRDWEEQVSCAFIIEVQKLLEGSLGNSGIYTRDSTDALELKGRKAALLRSECLDEFSSNCWEKIGSYPTGLDADVISRREENRQRILDELGGTLDDWYDYRWQIRNVVKSLSTLRELINLTREEIQTISLATDYGIPFGITPYYISLMDVDSSRMYDHAVRAQVIPPLSYVTSIMDRREDLKQELDFMKEHDTSPVDLITRRYPMIAIMKPYNTCAQICVYCQRNWEIDDVLCPTAMASDDQLDKSISWFQDHPNVTEVLVTGGDPALMSDRSIEKILGRLAEIEHIERIRIGTRVPAVLPMRMDDAFAETVAIFHSPPCREVCLVTHFEHPYEITPDSMEATLNIRRRGMMIYNQEVFTFENSRRFETAALRLCLKRIGIDPYYTFNTKGKEETDHYRVPIARILQERKEEARVLPGIVRTDEPVFNIPALGKNHLRAGQHHEYIMLSPQGERFYEFHPWEKNINLADTYVYKDVPILDYLERLEAVGEDIQEYSNIWYYF